MSNNVDNRVVQMDFDNAKFERGIKTTLESLTRLKSELDMEKSSRSLSRLQKASNMSLDSVGRTLDSLNRKFSTFGTVWTTTVENITNHTINKFRDAINQIKTGGFSRAHNIEQADFMMQGLLSDEEKAAGKLEEITTAAMNSVTETAYGYDSAAKAAAQFFATGIKDGTQMEQILKGVAGAAAMTGRDYDDIAHIFTTVAGNGRLMGEQLNQFATSGLNVAATLAEQLHTTEAEIREMTSKGEIDFETFANAMARAYGDHAKEANKTFDGALSNMKAAMNRIGAEFYTPYMEYMRDIFNAMTPVINALKKTLAPVIKTYSVIFGSLSKNVVSWLGKLQYHLDRLGKRLTFATKTFEYVKGFETLLEGLKNLANSISTIMKPIGDAFSEVFDQLMKFWRPMTKLEKADKTMQKYIKHARQFKKELGVEKGEKGVMRRGILKGLAMNDLVTQFKDFTASIKISDKTLENLKNTFLGLFSIVDLAARAFAAVAKAIFPVAKEGSSLIEVILSITGAIGIAIAKLDNFVKETKAFDYITKGLRVAFGAIYKVLNFIFGAIYKVFTTIYDTFSKLYIRVKVLISIFSVLKAVFDSILGFNIFDGIKSSISRIGQGIKYITGQVRTLFDMYKKVFQAKYIDRFSDKMDKLKIFSIIYSFLVKILNVLISIGDSLFRVNLFKLINELYQSIPALKEAKDRFVSFIKSIDSNGRIKGIADKFVAALKRIKEDGILSFIKSLNIKDRFKSLTSGFVDALKKIKKDGIVSFVKSLDIKGKLFSFGDKIKSIDWGGIGNKFKDGIKVIGQNLLKLKDIVVAFYAEHISDRLKNIFESIKEVIKGLGTSIAKKFPGVASAIGSAMKTISGIVKAFGGGIANGFKAIADVFKKINWLVIEEVVGGIVTGLFVFNQFKTINKTVKNFSGALESFKKVGDGLGQFLENFGTFKIQHGTLETKFDQLIKIAKSLLLLSAALKIISTIPVDRIIPSLLTLVGMLGGLVVFAFLLQFVLKKVDIDKMKGLADTLVSLSISMVLLSAALSIINSAVSGNDEWWKSVAALGLIAGILIIMMGALGLIVKSADKVDVIGMFKISAAMISMGKAVKILSESVGYLSEIKDDNLMKGLKAIGAIIVLLTIFTKIAGDAKYALRGALSLILLGASILEIQTAMLIFSKMSWGTLLKGGAVIVALMLLFERILKAGKDSSSSMSSAVLIISMIAFIKTICNALVDVADFIAMSDPGTIVGAVAIMGALMGFLYYLTTIGSDKGAGAAKSGLAFTAIAAGILLMAYALQTLSNTVIKLSTIPKILIALGVGLLALLAITKWFGKEAKGALSFALIGAGMFLLASAIAAITALPIAALAIALGKLAVSLAVIGAIMAVLGKVAGMPMLIVGAAFALVAVSVLLLAYSFKVLVEGLKNLLPLIVLFAAVPDTIMAAGLAAIATAMETIAIGLVKLGGGFVVLALGLATTAISAVLLGAGLVVASLGALLLSASILALSYAITTFASAIIAAGGQIGEAIHNIFDFVFGGIKGMLEGLVGHFADAFGKIGERLGVFRKDIDEKLSDTDETGKEVSENIAKGIEDNKEVIPKAVNNAVDPKSLFGGLKDGILSGGSELGSTFGGGFADTFKSIIPEQVGGIDIGSYLNTDSMGDAGVNAAAMFGGDFQDTLNGLPIDGSMLGTNLAESAENPESMQKAAKSNVDSYVSELENSKKPGDAGDKIGKTSAKSAKNKEGFKQAATDNVDGFVQGLTSDASLQRVYNAGKRLGEFAKKGEKDATESSSPSRVFIKLGMYLSQGFAIGIERFSDLAFDAAYDMGRGSTDVVKHMLSNISDAVDTDFEYNPTITPVVDMSNVTASSNAINSMFGSNTFGLRVPNGLELAGTIAADLNNQNGAQYAIADQVSDLAKKLDSMTNSMNSRQLIQNNYIDGTADPNAFADQLTRKMKLNVRTM